MSSEALHRLGGKLVNDARFVGLSARQEALWACVVSEMEYRNRRRVVRDRCTCLICMAPFVDDDQAPAEGPVAH